MPAGSETIIAGQYTVTYGGVALGIFEGDAQVPAIEWVHKTEPIANTDAYGKTTIDHIGQGLDAFFSGTCLEYKAGPISAMWPLSTTLGRLGVIGRLYYDIAAALVLTAIAGTPAVTSPATLTASRSILAPGFNVKLLYGPTLRKVPLRLQLLPYTSTVVVFFTTT